MSDSKIRMADVFDLPVTAEQHDECNGWWTVDTANSEPVDESGDGGFYQKTAEAIAHAINNHDHLTAENEALQAEVVRLHALWEKETERAHVAEGELLKSRVRLVTIKQECDQLKAQINSMKQAIDELIEHSYGVAGLHLNGEVAKWSDLRGDGRFCEWLAVFDDTPGKCLANHDAEVIERAINEVEPNDDSQDRYCRWLEGYANQLRQQNTEEN